jgi:hypothetical protein
MHGQEPEFRPCAKQTGAFFSISEMALESVRR